ncbi:hypothetical protein ACI2K4_30165 [Micromonospora sp. NPDC050397]|uniref:hypothetical protein n=1 Tax=Micromonospora sp. NPDC050397 TaxID=3364279 RepID=UPI003850DB52
MSRATDEALRRAVRALADEARGVDGLAALAMARGRRVRRRRRAVGTVAGVAAFLVLAAPFVWLRPGSGPDYVQPVGALTGAPSAPGDEWTRTPFPLSDSMMIIGGTSTGSPSVHSYAFDRTRDGYPSFAEYDELWAAPRGNLAAAYDYSRREETGLVDVPTRRVDWVRTGNHLQRPQWSPDGGRLLLTATNKESPTGLTAVILTAADHQVREIPVDGERYPCTGPCQFTWSPDGTEIVLPQTDPGQPPAGSGPDPRRGLQLFSAATGEPTRLLPIRGEVTGPYSWSEDGELVVVRGARAQLTDARTGQVVRGLPGGDAFWVAGDRLMYPDGEGENVVLAEIDLLGNELRRVPLPPELAHRELLVGPR